MILRHSLNIFFALSYDLLMIFSYRLTDGAHLARMKSRADAEYYTAVKLAEANKVYV